MQATQIPEENCEGCGHSFDTASEMTGNGKPEPGDLSICLYCGHLSVFDNAMRHRELTGKQMVDAAGDVRVLAIQAKIWLQKQ